MTTRPRRTRPEKKALKGPKAAQPPAKAPDEAWTRTVLQPATRAAFTLLDHTKAFGDISLRVLVDELSKQCDLASSGNLTRAEAMLVSQAHTLDAIFHTLARWSGRADLLSQYDTLLRLGLKAQAQCRATLETLAAIKNPPVAFVRQANIAHGPQQVNNGGAVDHSRAENSENLPDRLLEQTHGERLDFGATGAAGSADSAMETVGALHGPEDAGR